MGRGREERAGRGVRRKGTAVGGGAGRPRVNARWGRLSHSLQVRNLTFIPAAMGN